MSGASILELRYSQSSLDKNRTVKVRGQKCVCGRVWCSSCAKSRTLKKFAEHVRCWPWDQVRQVVLSGDPKAWESPAEFLQDVHDHKRIPSLIRNLKRTHKKKILDWIWIMEWYQDGMPHWHLLLLMDEKGKAAMIGQELLHKYWGKEWIKESYFDSEKRWKGFAGYFHKTGYFQKNKAHQSRLPDWARELVVAPRRMGRQARKRDLTENTVDPDVDPSGWLKEETRKQVYLRDQRLKNDQLSVADEYWKEEERLNIIQDQVFGRKRVSPVDDRITAIAGWMENQKDPYTREKKQGEALDLCGEGVRLFYGKGWSHPAGLLGVPYKEWREFPGAYVDGEGYYSEMPLWFFESIKKMHDYEKYIRKLRSG